MTHSTAKPVPSARRLAYQALYDVLEKDAYSNIVLQRILAEYPLKAEEAHLLTELVYGAFGNTITYSGSSGSFRRRR